MISMRLLGGYGRLGIPGCQGRQELAVLPLDSSAIGLASEIDRPVDTGRIP